MIDSDMWAVCFMAATAAGKPPLEAEAAADHLMGCVAVRWPEHEVDIH